jgi:hypothetical protein
MHLECDTSKFDKCWNCDESKDDSLLEFDRVMVGYSAAFHFHLSDKVYTDSKKNWGDIERHELYEELRKRLECLINPDQGSLFDFFSVENFHNSASSWEVESLKSHFQKKPNSKNYIVNEIYTKIDNQKSYPLQDKRVCVRFVLKPFAFKLKDGQSHEWKVYLSFFPAYQTAIITFNIDLPSGTNTDDVISTAHLFEKNREMCEISYSQENSIPFKMLKNEYLEESENKVLKFCPSQVIDLYILSVIKCVVKNNDEKNGLLQTTDIHKQIKAKSGIPYDHKNAFAVIRDKMSQKYGKFTYLDQIVKNIYCEIKGIKEPFVSNALDAVKKYPKQMYGILVRDEGWRYVPLQLAYERLDLNWGSRCFFNIHIFKENILLINLIHTSCVKDCYAKDRNTLPCKTPKAVNTLPPSEKWDDFYYMSNLDVACLSHGVLLMIEKLHITRSLIAIAPRDIHSQKKNFRHKIKEINLNRANLNFLRQLSYSSISEMNELYVMMFDSLNIKDQLEIINSSLNVITEDLKIIYEGRTNLFVEILTFAGLFTAIATCLLEDRFNSVISDFIPKKVFDLGLVAPSSIIILFMLLSLVFAVLFNLGLFMKNILGIVHKTIYFKNKPLKENNTGKGNTKATL